MIYPKKTQRYETTFYKATGIANFFLSLDKENAIFKQDKNSKQRLNNYLYCAQVNWIAKTGQPLFEDQILSAKAGGTIREIEKQYDELINNKQDIELPYELADFLERIYKRLEYADNQGVTEVIQTDPAWQQYYYKKDKDGYPLNIIGNTITYAKCYRSSIRALYE